MSRPPDQGPVMYGFERVIGRVLIALTYIAVTLLTVGVVLMLAQGIDPLDGGPGFTPGTVLGDVLALDPAGPLWLGILLVLATPITRVITAGVAYARHGQWTMVAVATGITTVILVAVVTALITEI